MSKYIKYPNSKLKSNSTMKLNNMINSYNSLKKILSPNITENNNFFLNSLLDLIISQLKIYITIYNTNETRHILEILNKNNQNLSKQIAFLYEISKNSIRSSVMEKDKSECLNSFRIEEDFSNSNIIESKIKETKFRTEKSKEKKNKLKKVLFQSNKSNKSDDGNNNIKNIFNKEEEKNQKKNFKSNTQCYIKINKKEKKEEDKGKINNIKSSVIAKSTLQNHLKKIKNWTGGGENCAKFRENSLTDRQLLWSTERKNDNPYKKTYYLDEISKTISKQKTGKLLFYDTVEDEEKTKKENNFNFKRREKKAKTVHESFQLPYLIGIEKNGSIFPIDKYISVTFTNRFLDKLNKSKNSKVNKNKTSTLIKVNQKKILNQRKSSSSTAIHKSLSQTYHQMHKMRRKKSDEKKNEKNFFSLDDFLTPAKNKKGEKYYITKEGKVLITKKQKNILEDYINNYLFDENEEICNILNKNNKNKNEYKKIYSLIPMSKELRKKIKLAQNKKYKLKGTSIKYDLNDITELFQILPASFQIPIDDFFLRKKRASMFERGIFQICHKVLNDYKVLEDKEDRFRSRGKITKSARNIHNNRYGDK